MLFKKILNESGHYPNKIWIGKGSKFYNRSMKFWLEDNGIKMYSRNKEGKFVFAERFIRIIKSSL